MHFSLFLIHILMKIHRNVSIGDRYFHEHRRAGITYFVVDASSSNLHPVRGYHLILCLPSGKLSSFFISANTMRMRAREIDRERGMCPSRTCS